MKNTNIKLGAGFLFASLHLFSGSVYAQDTTKVEIKIAEVNELRYAYAYSVSKKALHNPEQINYFVNSEFRISENFAGNYTKYPQSYKVAKRSEANGEYFEGELVDASKTGFYLSEDTYSVVVKDNDSLFAVKDKNLESILKARQTAQMLQSLEKLGYKTYQDGEDYYFKSKTSELKVTSLLLDQMKKDSDFITKLDAQQTKRIALAKQTIPHSKTLDKYLGQYRIQRNKMPTADLTAWRTATTNAQKLNLQLIKMNESGYQATLLDKSYNKLMSEFADNLLASKGVLGM